MKNTLFLSGLALTAGTSLANAQVLVSDDFSYVGALTSNGWTAHSGAGNKIIMSNGSVATLEQSTGTGEDDSLNFPPQGPSDTTYFSFTLNVPSGNPVNVDIDGLYFAHLKEAGFFHARVSITAPALGGDFGLGISNSFSVTGGVVWPNNFAFDTNYQVVCSWDASTDTARMWIDPTSVSDPSIVTVGLFPGDMMDAFALRQSNDYTGFITVDNVIVGETFDDVSGPLGLGTASCFGDGSGEICPCLNFGGPGEGCQNSTGQGGILTANGQCFPGNNTIQFFATNMVPGKPALLLMGNQLIGGGTGLTFGDGIRCVGNSLARLSFQHVDSGGTATYWAIPGPHGISWELGSTRHFQVWYLDCPNSPCGTNSNFTNAYSIVIACDPNLFPQPSNTPAVVLTQGEDALMTSVGSATSIDFGSQPIPADFFYPGSDAYTGTLALHGEPLMSSPPNALGDVDTIVRRLVDTIPLGVGASDTIPIEMKALNLVSTTPIIVTGTQGAADYDVQVCLWLPQTTGSMTINRLCTSGGSFDSLLPVSVKLVFTGDGPGAPLEFGPLFVDFHSTDSPWGLVGAPNCWNPAQLGLQAIPPGVSFDSNCDGTNEATTIGSSNFRAGVAACADEFTHFPCATTTEDAVYDTHEANPAGDIDNDSWPDCLDNCPGSFNPDQADCDGDGTGDVCDGLRARAACFCDGTAGDPPCDNFGGPGEGCANSTGSGAVLSACGSTSPNTVQLKVTGAIPGKTVSFYYGSPTVTTPKIYTGAGLTCLYETKLKDLGKLTADAAGTAVLLPHTPATTNPPAPVPAPGTTVRYWCIYIDSSTTSCPTTVNSTNAIDITW